MGREKDGRMNGRNYLHFNKNYLLDIYTSYKPTCTLYTITLHYKQGQRQHIKTGGSVFMNGELCIQALE